MRATRSLPCRAPSSLVALTEQSVSFGPTEAGGHKGHLSSQLSIYPQVTACSGEGFKGDYSANIVTPRTLTEHLLGDSGDEEH